MFLHPSPAWSQSNLDSKCRQLGREGNLRAAIQLVDKYEVNYPKDAFATLCRGTAKLRLGDHKGAILDYRKAYLYGTTDEVQFEVLVGTVKLFEEIGDRSKMCETWNFFKLRNMRAIYINRINLNTEYGRKIDRTCSY